MELKFDEYLAGSGPRVQERWIGPWTLDEDLDSSETTKADEDGENEQEDEHEELQEEESR